MIIQIDDILIHWFSKISLPFGLFALFIVFFWFGALKVFAISPAKPLVAALLAKTIPFFTTAQFIFGLGIYEMIIGIAFIIPRCERLAIALLVPHLITTVLPLILLPAITWQGFFIPTLEGQYIIKNVLIIAVAMVVAAQLTPFSNRRIFQ